MDTDVGCELSGSARWNSIKPFSRDRFCESTGVSIASGSPFAISAVWVSMKERIAIVGGGVAGLTAGYLLNQKYDVTLFEKSSRIGGNAWTYVTRDGEEVDIAVAAFSKTGYMHLFELFSRLKIRTRPYRSYLSLHDLDTKTGLYLTPSMKGLLAQRFRVLRPKHVQEVFRILKVVKTAKKLLQEGEFEGLTLREGLEKLPYMTGYTRLVLLSALRLMSSLSHEAALDGPAEFYMKLVDVHRDALSLWAPYSVMGADDMTKSYVEALASGYRDRVIFNSDIETIIRQDGQVVILMQGGKRRVFDKVVFACGADQSLALLASPTPEEERLLGAWKYSEVRQIVHRDYSSFPKKALMEGYVFNYKERNGITDISVSAGLWYHWKSRTCNAISSQEPNFPIDPDLVEFEAVMRVPIYDFESFATLDDLPSLNGVRNAYYCGSYYGLGLHEDAVRSAVEVAKLLNVDFWESGSGRASESGVTGSKARRKPHP